MAAEFFRADGRMGRQTDVKKLKIAFRSFASAPKNVCPF
jgi:hypothetical protein